MEKKMQTNPSSSVVTLDWGENTQCSVNLHGCTITSWRLKNLEQLFVSRHARFDHRKEIMGGIAIDFPKYGGWHFGPSNGFACISEWKVLKAPHKLKGNNDVVAAFQLVDNPHTRSFWNFPFEVINTITLSELAIEMKIKIRNTSWYMPMRFNLMFPMFIKVPNAAAVQIVGMNNVEYHDETAFDNVVRIDRKKAIEISAWTYRIYKHAPHSVQVFHITSDYSVKVENTGLEDFMVWNPWTDHGDQVDDFRAEQFKEMICIGMGNINKEIRLEPGAEYDVGVKLEINTGQGICAGLY